ncbi:MAG: polyprenyl synthetase family protein [Albidovulum sp.]|nr:polyprenyl synthetase family protein [Albidovulum sp.]MDE0307219.1 polyprenyl synthetase family protein [Albidovulum sp.]MDE0531947.1 polyprenyl synthetase family protein [Albidovulum sp.]
MNKTVENTDPLSSLVYDLRSDLDATSNTILEQANSTLAPRIGDVSAHLFKAGGKRIRPILTLAAATALGYRGELHVQAAAAVEFIHMATLLHDDVIDESDQRRKRPTANLLWDNRSSILVGDFLLARALQLLVELGSGKVLEALSAAAVSIAEGEILQLSTARSLQVDETTYRKIIEGKTSALFAAAAESGGAVGGADSEQLSALREFGHALGISFQIVDDVLDYGGDSVSLGKNVGDDFRDCKVTLPVIKAVSMADEAESRFWRRVIEIGEQRLGDLEHAQELLLKHGSIESAKQEAVRWSTIAQASLEKLPDHPIRGKLADLSRFVTERAS